MVHVSSSIGVSGGILEASSAYLARWGIAINKRKIPLWGKLLVSDASSPVPNFRVEEAFMSLLVLLHTSPLVRVVTEVGCGGTHAEYGKLWNLRPRANNFWLKFYQKTGIMDRINPKFAPIGSGVYWAVLGRWFAVIGLWLMLIPYLGIGSLVRVFGYQVRVFEFPFKFMRVSSLISAVPDGGVILKFPCPVCSHQAQETVYHAVRRQGNGIIVAKSDRSPSPSGCKGGFPWKEKWNSLTVWEATFKLGGRVSGKSSYYLSSRQLFKPAMLVRDYSDPRGTLAETIKNWSSRIWISPRVYLSHGSACTVADLRSSIAANPQAWTNVLKKFPLLGDGKRYEVTF